MPLTPNFTTSQSLGYPSKINLTDNSTGSDGAVASRRIYPTDFAGTSIVSDGNTNSYEPWALSDTSTTIDILNYDMALFIKVDWLDSGNSVLYTKTIPNVYRLYAITQYINLLKAQSGNSSLINRANFYQNLTKLLCSLKQAYDAIYYAGDVASAQRALNVCKELINNKSYFY